MSLLLKRSLPLVALLLAQGLPALEGEAPAVAHSRKGGSPLDMLDRSLVPDKLPPEVVAVLAGPEGRATCMFTPDGASLLVGSDTGSLCFWHFGGRRPQPGLEATTEVGEVFDLAFTADAKTIAVVGLLERLEGSLGTLEVWEVGAALRRREVLLNRHRPLIRQATFSPDGAILAAASGDSVFLWDMLPGGAKQRPTLSHSPVVRALAFSPDGRSLATAGEGRVVWLWEVATGGQREQLSGLEGECRSLRFISEGRRLGVVRSTGEVGSWLPGDGKGPAVHARVDASKWAVAWANDGKLATQAYWPWRVAQGEPPEGRSRVSLWATTGQRISSGCLQGEVATLVWAPDNRHVAVGMMDGTVYILRIPN